jgi:multidrug efflux pump subunit AcrB
MISWFARNHVAANLLMLAIMAAGMWTLISERVPLEVFPDQPSRTISVNVPYPGATPEEVEESIILRIEEAVQQVAGIKHMNSTASSSGGTVLIEVEETRDPREVMEEVRNKIDTIPNFPELAERPVIQVDDMFHSVINVVIAADMSESDLRRLGEQVRDELAALPDVTHVGLGGVRPYEIAIEIPEESLRKHGLTLDAVSQAIRSSAIDLPAGVVQTEAGDVSIRTRGRAYTGADYERVVVLTRPDGSNLTLGNIARISDGFNENPLLARLDGKRCVVINVMREGDQNAIRIAEEVKEYIASARERLPDGVQIEFWNDRSKIVKGRINLLMQNAQSSLILVFLFVGLFLRLDAVIWVAVGMVASFLGAIALMPYFDTAINLSSLFGFILVLGIVVDDAIVISEHVDTMRQEGLPPLEAAIRGTREMAVPITFGVLTTVIAFLPMAIGVSDFLLMFKPIAVVFILVMLIALVETKIILPAHLAHPIPGLSGASDILGPVHRFSDRMLQKFVDIFYRPSLRWCVHHRYATLACFFGGLLVLTAFFFSGRILWVFFPRVQSERIEARLTMLDGTPFEVTDSHIQRIYDIAEQMRREYVGPDGKPVIRAILATTGTTRLTSGRGGQGTTGSSHIGEVTLETYGPEERSLKVNTVDMANEWRQRIGTIVGAEELNFRAEIGRTVDPIDIQLTGTDPDELLVISAKIKDQLATYSGVFDISDSLDSGRNEIQLRLKPEARQFGVTVSDLARQVRQAFYGDEVQRIQRGPNEVKVMLRYPRADRKSLATLETMRVRTADGMEIPFARVAEAQVGKSFTSIKRIDRRRAMNVTADVNKATTDPAKVRADLEIHIREILAAYPHVQWSFEGEARAQREGADAGKWALVIIVLGLYSMMAIPFRSYTQPLIVLLVVPFGIVGAVLGHLYHSLPLSSMSVCGMLAVTGVIVNDTLVLVDRINQLHEETGDLKYAVQEGGRSRFRAIFLTQITTFVGLMPLIFEFGSLIENSPPGIRHLLVMIFGDDRAAQATSAQFLTPVSVAMGYGSLFATVITLFLVPLCYLVIADIGRAWRWVYPSRRVVAPTPPAVAA